MRASLIEAIKNVEAEDAPRFSDLVYVDPAVVVDALVEWLHDNNSNIPVAVRVVATEPPGEYGSILPSHVTELADLLSEET